MPLFLLFIFASALVALSALGCSNSHSVPASEQRIPVTPKAAGASGALAQKNTGADAGISVGTTGQLVKTPAAPLTSDVAVPPDADSVGSAVYPDNYAEQEGWSLAEKQAATFIYSAPVFFYSDSAALTDQAKQVLRQKEEKLKAFPQFKVIIAGHCDERGTDTYNYALGGRRAKAALDYLVELGVPQDRLDSISYGKSNPKVSAKDESGRSQNRRDDFHVTKK